MNVLADKAVPDTEAVLALNAELAPATRETWIDHHAISNLHTLNAGARLDNVTGDVTASPKRQRGFQGRAEILKYANSYVAIQASLNKPGVLVLTDSFYPGWRVYVDGKEKEILRANVFFRAVPLSAGEHVVDFRYRPRSFTIGLAISLLTVSIIVVSSIVFALLERRRSVGNGPTSQGLP